MPDAAVRRGQPYPMVLRADWTDDDLAQANHCLDKLSSGQRAAILALAAEPELDRREAIELVQALCRLCPRERRQIGILYSQPESRGYAVAAALYSRKSWTFHWKDARDTPLERVVNSIEACLKLLPEDPLVPQLQRLLSAGQGVLAAVRQQHDERIQQRYAGMSVRDAVEQARADMRMEGPGKPGLD